jgi:hypothetical protein
MDELPPDVTASVKGALVRALDSEEL